MNRGVFYTSMLTLPRFGFRVVGRRLMVAGLRKGNDISIRVRTVVRFLLLHVVLRTMAGYRLRYTFEVCRINELSWNMYRSKEQSR
jgi:hypothetical protein